MQNSVAAVPLHVYGQCAERFRRQRAREAAHDDLSGSGRTGSVTAVPALGAGAPQ